MAEKKRGRPPSTKKKAATELNRFQKAALSPVDRPDPPGTKYRCACCREEYPSQKGIFPVSHSPLFQGNNGFYPVCRKCIEQYYDVLRETIYDNEFDALFRIIMLCDWYYDEDLANISITGNKGIGSTALSTYTQRMSLPYIRDRGNSYMESVRNKVAPQTFVHEENSEFGKALQAQREEEKAAIPAVDETIVVTNEMRRFWGLGFKDEEYIFLQTQYLDWVERHVCETKAQEEIFKNLCLTQLEIVRVQQAHGDVSKVMKSFRGLVEDANISPRQLKGDISKGDTFGTLIREWENDDPIPEPAPEWRDVDGIMKYISVWVLGHLSKMMKIDNDWADMYEEEIAKYTAKKPEYNGEFDYGGSEAVGGEDE